MTYGFAGPRRTAQALLLGAAFAATAAGSAPAQSTNPWTPPGVAPTARYPGEGAEPAARYPGGAASPRDSLYAPAGLDAELSGGLANAQPANTGDMAAPGTAGSYPAAGGSTYAPLGVPTPASPFAATSTAAVYAPPQAGQGPAQPPASGMAGLQTPYAPGAPYTAPQPYVNASPYPLGTPTPAPATQPAPRMPAAATRAPQVGSVAATQVPGTYLPYAVPVNPGTIGVVPVAPIMPGALPSGSYGNLPYAGYGALPYGGVAGLPYGAATGLPYGAGAGLPYGGMTGWPYGGTGAGTGLWPGGLGTGWPGGLGSGLPGGFGTGWPGGLGTGWPTTGYSPYGFW